MTRHGRLRPGPLIEQIRGRKCSFPECARKHNARGLCLGHVYQLADGKELAPLRKMASRGSGSIKDGYRLIYRPGHPNSQPSNGLVYEHRYLMSEALGRPLLDAEEVHHKNGDKLDNRVTRGHEIVCPSACCNLELWSQSQPPGQRVRDRLDWARWFLAEYGTPSEKKFFKK